MLPGRHMSIDLGGGNGAVAQQGLYVPDIRAAVQQSRGKGMAKHMGRNASMHRRCLNMPGNDLPHPLGGQRPSPPVN